MCCLGISEITLLLLVRSTGKTKDSAGSSLRSSNSFATASSSTYLPGCPGSWICDSTHACTFLSKGTSCGLPSNEYTLTVSRYLFERILWCHAGLPRRASEMVDGASLSEWTVTEGVLNVVLFGIRRRARMWVRVCEGFAHS